MSIPAVTAGSLTRQSATPLIDQWLASKQLIERRRARLQPTDLLFCRIAADAMHSDPARRLLQDIHSKLSTEDERLGRIRLGADEHQNQLALGVANSLAAVGLLRAVDRSDTLLDFSLNGRRSQAGARLRTFVTGRWLEIGVEQVIRSVLGEEAEIVRNLQVEHPVDGVLELDVVAIVDGAPVVFECKSGRHVAPGLPRFGDVARTIGVEGERAVVVAPHMDSPDAVIAEEFFSIRIIGPGEVEGHAGELRAVPAPGRNLRLVATAEAAPPESGSTELEEAGSKTAGGKRKVTLEDAFRAELEAIVHRVVDGSPGTHSAGQLAAGLRDRARCGRAKANYVVTGLLFDGRLLDADGRSIKDYRAMVHKVANA